MINKEELLNIIIEHGLSLRQIPETVTSLFSMERYNPEKHTIVEHELTQKWCYKFWVAKHLNSKDARFDHERKIVYRKYAKEIIVPKNAGYWMCKKVNSTLSTVQWNANEDNLAPTLLDSVMLYLNGKSKNA